MIPCSWKSTLGIECPGCGFQRSVAALFHGDLYQSLILYPATIPLLLTFVVLLLHLWLKFKHGAKAIVILFSSSAAIILISYIVKISMHGIYGEVQ